MKYLILGLTTACLAMMYSTNEIKSRSLQQQMEVTILEQKLKTKQAQDVQILIKMYPYFLKGTENEQIAFNSICDYWKAEYVKSPFTTYVDEECFNRKR